MPSQPNPSVPPESSPVPDPAQVRVAIFSDALPERNGTGAYYHDLAEQLASRVGALQVFQPGHKGRYATLSCPMPGDPMQRLAAPALRRIAKDCKELRPNIVVAVTPGPFGLLALYHARRSGAAFISAFHTDFEHLARIYWNRLTGAVVNTCLRTANRILFRRSATVLVNNSNLRDDVLSLGAPSVEVMGTPLPQELLTRPTQPIPAPLHKICFAGRLAPEKNLHLVLEAARRLPRLNFVLGGDGPLREKLETEAKDLPNVRFAGWLSRTGLIELLDASTLLLLPSKFETFGSVALEAMARGRPALVAANAGIHDWQGLSDGLLKLQVNARLADTLNELLRHTPDFWQKKSVAARAAADAFNNKTLEQWAATLAAHAKF
ncbi:MAG: glycosyltransferase [Opitutales bacterium]